MIFSFASTAEAALEWHKRVTPPDTRHNAFTDLTYWNGYYYLCYRNGDAHNSMDGSITIGRSQNMKEWHTIATLNTMGDDRDPHFTVTPDRLYCFFGVWDLTHRDGHATPNRKDVRSHVAWTEDGEEWSDVKGVWEPGWWLWRVRYFNGQFVTGAYTAKRPTPDMRETLLLVSDDALNWRKHSVVTDEHMAGESDMWLEADQSLSLITRTGDGNAMLYRADPHWKNWDDGTRLSGIIHAPVVAFINGRQFVAGRARNPEGDGSLTKVWEIVEGESKEVLTLPSAGDTSYCGLIPAPDKDDALYISWYSQHETTGSEAAVYAGEISIGE